MTPEEALAFMRRLDAAITAFNETLARLAGATERVRDALEDLAREHTAGEWWKTDREPPEWRP